jgi:hypothetical protein
VNTLDSLVGKFQPPNPAPCIGGCGVVIVGNVCPACAARIEAGERQAHRMDAIRKVVEQIPKRFRDARVLGAHETLLSEGRVRPTHRAAIEYVKRVALAHLELKPITIFRGPSGEGKTSLMTALLNEWIAAASKPEASEGLVSFVTGAAYTSAYWPAKARAENPLGRGEAPIVDRAINATVLFLDDLGHEAVRSSAIPEILFERQQEARPTILTTKLRADGIADHYRAFDGEGLARRLYESRTTTLVALENA